MRALLAIEDLSLDFGETRVLDGVSLSVAAGETVALVGESGAGKSVAALAVMGLNDRAAKLAGGRILFEGEDLIQASEKRLRALRGRKLAYVFQNPRRALHPGLTIGQQLQDVLAAHARLSGAERKARARDLLAQVGVDDPSARLAAYPFELSGGLCQRAALALALAASPSLLIADELTTGLDVVNQAIVLDLLTELTRRERLALLLITHDLAVAAERCRRIAVMHAGQIVEIGPAADIVAAPLHPCTQALVAATPRPGLTIAELRTPARLTAWESPACRFAPLCPKALDICGNARPALVEITPGRNVACWAVAP